MPQAIGALTRILNPKDEMASQAPCRAEFLARLTSPGFRVALWHSPRRCIMSPPVDRSSLRRQAASSGRLFVRATRVRVADDEVSDPRLTVAKQVSRVQGQG